MIRNIILLIPLMLWNFHIVQAQQWAEHYKAAVENYQKDNISAAYKSNKKALKLYLQEDGGLSENYAAVLHLLSTICYDSALYEEGILYAEKEIALRREISEVPTTDLATALYNHGSLCLSASINDDAERSFLEALEIYKQYFAADHNYIVTCYWKLGTVYLNKEEWAKSCAYFTNGFDLYGDPENVDMDYLSACYDMATASAANGDIRMAINYYSKVADIYYASGYEQTIQNQYVQLHLGDMYKEIQDYATAVAFYDNVIRLGEQISAEDDKLLSQALKGKAYCLQAMGKNDEASAIYTKEAINDPYALNNAAAIAHEEGRLKDAENLYKKALEIVKADSASAGNQPLEISINLIHLYLQSNKLDSAELLISKTENLIKSLHLLDHPLYSSLLIRKAQLFLKQNDYAQSHNYFSKAEGIIRTTLGEESVEYVNLLNNMAVLHLEQGVYHEAEELLQKSTSIAERIDYPQVSLINLYNNKAALFQELGKFADATELLEKGIDLLQSRKLNPVIAGNTYRQKGLMDIQLGNFDQAHQMLSSAKETFNDIYGESHSVLARHSIDMARLLQAQGKYADAEKEFIDAIEKMRTSLGDNHPEFLSAINSLGVLYQTMGNYAEALRHFKFARDGYIKVYGKGHPGYATTIGNISTTYQLTGQYDKVEPLLLEAIEIDKIIYGDKHSKYAVSLHNLATYYLKNDDFDKAKPLFEEALSLYENAYGLNYSSYATTLFNLAIVNQETGNLEVAEKQLKKTLEIRKKILGKEHPDYAFTLFGLADLYFNKDELNKAGTFYKESVERYLHQIENYFPVLSEKEKSAFFNKIKPVFSSYADFAITYYESTGKGEVVKDLYDLQLATKAILLNASNKVRERIMTSGDNELIANYHRWTNLKEQLIKIAGLLPEEQRKLEIDPSALEEQINTLEKELSERSGLFATTHEKEQVKWRDVQKNLVENEAAIEIMRVNKRFSPDSIFYVALIVKPAADPVAVIIPQGHNLEHRLYNYYRNAIKFAESDTISYNNFWAPIDAYLSGTDKCYVSTDGIYNKVSLATLYNPVKEKYLIDELDIHLLSNTREIAEPTNEFTARNFAVAFGSPDFDSDGPDNDFLTDQELTRMLGFSDNKIPALPGTKMEVENLKDMLQENNWEADIYLEERATENNFKKIMNPSILHVATHGFFMSDISGNEEFGVDLKNSETNPLFRSGLLLTGAAKGLKAIRSLDDEDGILTAYEAMNLHLDKTNIVILSACETGLGQIRNGEGVYGLQRAFIVAGAKSVVMSLWKVNDETTMELMTAFYGGLLKGEDKFTAFRQAQLRIREKYRDSFHWGAFVMLGK